MPALCSLLVRTPWEYCNYFGALHFRRNVDKPEQVQKFATSVAKSLGTT